MCVRERGRKREKEKYIKGKRQKIWREMGEYKREREIEIVYWKKERGLERKRVRQKES